MHMKVEAHILHPSFSRRECTLIGDSMSNKLDLKETATFEEVLIANVFQQEAIINVLEQKGLLTRDEVMKETLELKKKSGK